MTARPSNIIRLDTHRPVRIVPPADLDAWLTRGKPPRDWPRFRVSRGDRITALAAYALVAMILGYFSAAYVGGGL